MCVYKFFLRVIIGSHNLLIPGCYMYMPDEVLQFHDWKSIRIKEEDGVHFLIDLKTRAVAPFFPDARTFHNIYKLQKPVLLRNQSYLIVFMGNTNLRFWPIMPL
jgi:hypothetical protein